MAMSQRTPSHCPAIFSSSPIIASCSGRVGVVELECVGPAGEIRITAVGEDQIIVPTLDPDVVLRSASQVMFSTRNEIVGMIFEPRMIEPHVIGYEVKHELQASLAESLAQAGQRSVPPKILMHRVAGDRKAGAGDVFLAQVRERLLELAAPLGIAARDLLRTRTGLPDAEEPDPVETQLGQAIQFGVRDVVQSDWPAQGSGQFRQPDAGIDLIK